MKSPLFTIKSIGRTIVHFFPINAGILLITTPCMPFEASREYRHEVPVMAAPANSPSPAVGFSSEPRLIKEGTVKLPLLLLIKKGVNGTVTVDVDIDQRGTVERCAIRTGVDSLLDSLVCASMLQSLFTPAYDEGKAVASTVALYYTFDLPTVVHNSTEAPADIRGTVVDAQDSLPIKNATINLEVIDSVPDPGVQMPTSDYLRLISGVAGQLENNGILSTTTDSAGRFAFRLLPSGRMRMAIIAPGFEIMHAGLTVQQNIPKTVICRLEPLKKDTITEIVVYGIPQHRCKIDIEEEQVATGLTHYLSGILQTKATIRSVPESRSSMMARAGSPFDNRYYICGVPFLAPYHFGGHAYADIDGMMISALSDVDLTVDRITGRQIDASGFRVDAQPSIYRPANRALLKRPEISVDLNTMGQDFLFSLPYRKNDAYLQVGVTRSENFTLKFLDSRRVLVENEYGNPRSYGNVTLTGSAKVKSVQLTSFSWLAWDAYEIQSDKPSLLPWGMAGITIRTENRKIPLIRCGGSRQYFASGRRDGSSLYRKDCTLSNSVLTFAYDSLLRGIVDASFEAQAEYVHWDGSVERTYQVLGDSIRKGAINLTYYVWKDTATESSNHTGGKEYSVQLHGTISKTWGRFTAAVDMLGAGLRYGTGPDAIGDAGASIMWQGEIIRVGLHGGRVTSRPDIRGLPDSLYRSAHIPAYLLSLPVTLRIGSRTKIELMPYGRKKINEPRAAGVTGVWIPAASTPLYASGTDIDAELRLFDWLSINSAINVSRARRTSAHGESLYEWDVPWSGRGNVHLQFGMENQIHIYINGIVSKGIPVEDVYNIGIVRLPDYHRIDVSFQYRSRFINHRFLTRYDGYFNFFNITDQYNATDYYWDQTGHLHAIPLGEFFCEMGVRFGFRL